MQKAIAGQAVTESSSNSQSEVWKKLWALPILNVEENFLWMARQDILPTRENLLKRKIINDPVCLLCGFMVGTGFHILWQCPTAMDVWGMSCGVKFLKCHFTGPGFLQVVEGMFRRCDQEEMAMFAGLARRVWMRRNEVLHGGKFSLPQLLIRLAARAREEYKDAQATREEDTQGQATDGLTKWVAPDTGWVKAS